MLLNNNLEPFSKKEVRKLVSQFTNDKQKIELVTIWVTCDEAIYHFYELKRIVENCFRVSELKPCHEKDWMIKRGWIVEKIVPQAVPIAQITPLKLFSLIEQGKCVSAPSQWGHQEFSYLFPIVYRGTVFLKHLGALYPSNPIKVLDSGDMTTKKIVTKIKETLVETPVTVKGLIKSTFFADKWREELLDEYDAKKVREKGEFEGVDCFGHPYKIYEGEMQLTKRQWIKEEFMEEVEERVQLKQLATNFEFDTRDSLFYQPGWRPVGYYPVAREIRLPQTQAEPPQHHLGYDRDCFYEKIGETVSTEIMQLVFERGLCFDNRMISSIKRTTKYRYVIAFHDKWFLIEEDVVNYDPIPSGSSGGFGGGLFDGGLFGDD